MARTTIRRNASLAPSDAELADELAAYITDGSFSRLIQMLLHTMGLLLRRHIAESQANGVEPRKRDFLRNAAPADTDEQIARFYAPSRWPISGPTDEQYGVTTIITATQLSKNLVDVLNRVRYRGERFTVSRNGEPIAMLGPSEAPMGITLRELAAQIGDVPLPDESFGNDIEIMRRSLAPEEPPTWSS